MKKMMISLGLALLAVVPAPLWAQQSAERPNSAADEKYRMQISDALKEGNFGAAQELLEKLQTSVKPQLQSPDAAGAALPQSGWVFFEEIKGCGFYPEETRLECVLDIKQIFGYGGLIGSPGSVEHVFFCVDSNNNSVFETWEPVG